MKPAAPVTRHFDPRAASMGFLCARDVVTAARPHGVGRRLPERRCKLSAVPVLSPKALQINEMHYEDRTRRRGRRGLETVPGRQQRSRAVAHCSPAQHSARAAAAPIAAQGGVESCGA